MNKGQTWIPIKVPVGCYDIVSINSFLQTELAKQKARRDDDDKKEKHWKQT